MPRLKIPGKIDDVEIVKETTRRGRGFRGEHVARDAPRAWPKNYSRGEFEKDQDRAKKQWRIKQEPRDS